MPNMPYSGTAVRNAHYSSRPALPGVNPDHTHPNPEPDPFNPQPVTPPNQSGDVFDVEEFANPSNQPNLAQVPVTHWYAGQPAVPSGEPLGRAQLALQARMMVDHMDTNYVPDSIRLYQNFSEGQENDFVIGRPPQEGGISLPDNAQFLANGKNSFDQTNQPNEVYGGDPANVGRYRLGVKTVIWGLYQNPLGKFGQEATLRAYTGLVPALPAAKPQMQGTAPYTPNSQGVAFSPPAGAAMQPSLFGLPSETAMTDFAVASEPFPGTNSDFVERNGGF